MYRGDNGEIVLRREEEQQYYEQVCRKVVGCIIQEIDCGLARAATLDVSPQRARARAGKGLAEAKRGQAFQTSCRSLAEKERTRFGLSEKLRASDLLFLPTTFCSRQPWLP